MFSSLSKEERKKVITIGIVGVVVYSIFSYNFVKGVYFSKEPAFSYNNSIDVVVEKVKMDRGFPIYNDSIGGAISVKLVKYGKINPGDFFSRYYEDITQLEPSFHLFKTAHTDTFRIIKQYDTLYYVFLKDDEPRFNLLFWDWFHKISYNKNNHSR